MRKSVIIVTILLIIAACSQPILARAEGEFVGYSQGDDEGYTEATVTLGEEGDIVEVVLREFDGIAREKEEHAEYDDYEPFQEAMEELPQRFVEANNYDVEMISGATITSNKAMEAVEMALAKAEGEEKFDGTFMARSEKTERGWGIVWLTVADGEITDIRLEEVSGDELKDEDYGWEAFHSAREEIAERMLAENDYEVDTYTGATGSSELWKEAAARALEMAGY